MSDNPFRNMLFLLVLLVAMSGCAVSSAALMDEERVFNSQPIARYKGLKIEEFILKREMVTSSDSSLNEREQRYLVMPAEIAATVERLVAARRIFPVVSRTVVPTQQMLVLKGEFTRVSRFKVAVTGHIVEGESGKEVAFFKLTLWDIYDTSKVIELIAKETSDFVDRIQYK